MKTILCGLCITLAGCASDSIGGYYGSTHVEEPTDHKPVAMFFESFSKAVAPSPNNSIQYGQLQQTPVQKTDYNCVNQYVKVGYLHALGVKNCSY